MIQSQEKQLAMQETKEREDHAVNLHSISIRCMSPNKQNRNS